MNERNQFRILLVEDEETDVLHFQRLCRKCGLDADIDVVSCGDDALRRLNYQNGAPQEKFIVITDLNLPGISGHDLISEIRRDPHLKKTVIFVLSTSDLEDDIGQAYQQHVAGYIVKDEAGDKLRAGVEMLQHYMLAVTPG